MTYRKRTTLIYENDSFNFQGKIVDLSLIYENGSFNFRV